MAKKKKVRKRRGWGGAFNPPLSKSKMDVGVMRRKDKAKAEEEFPDLVALFADIKAELKENLAKGRFHFRKSLKRMYKIIWDWDAEGFLDDNQVAIARLRGVALRAKTNRFNGIVAICSDRDRRTVSRWSQDLDTAYKAGVKPKLLISFLQKGASSQTDKPKAEEKAELAVKERKKKKKSKMYWGPKPAK